MNTIRADGCELRIGFRKTIQGLDFTLAPGSMACVCSSSGSARRAALAAMGGFQKPRRGTLAVLGRDAWKERSWVREKVAVIHATREWPMGTTLSSAEKLYVSLSNEFDRDRLRRLAAELGITERTHIDRGNDPDAVKARFALALASGVPVILAEDLLADQTEPARKTFFGLVAAEAAEGSQTIVIAARRLDGLELACNMAVILGDGALVAAGDADGIREAWGVAEVETVPEGCRILEHARNRTVAIGPLDVLASVTKTDVRPARIAEIAAVFEARDRA